MRWLQPYSAGMSQAFVDAFAKAMRVAQRAFNKGDFETAFAGLDPNVEWHSGSWVLDGGVLAGREEVIRLFVRALDAGDWQVEAVEFIDAGEGCVIVHQRGRSVGRTTRIGGTMDFFQLWETGPDGLVVRVREFESREDAVRAAGLPK